MSEDTFRRAIALCKKGQNLEARKILEYIVQEDPQKDIAWIWLANTYTEVSDRIEVLKEWRKSNPKSLNARNWLAAYKKKPREFEKFQKRGIEIQSSQIFNHPEDETLPGLVLGSDRNQDKEKSNSKKLLFLIPAFTISLLLLVGLGFLIAEKFPGQGALPSRIIVISPSPSPSIPVLTSTSTPSLNPTPLFSPIASSSSTPTPSPTETSFLNTAIININHTYLYAGPSVNHKLIQCPAGNCIYPRGTQVILLEKHEYYGETWFRVETPDGKSGWLNESWLLISGDQNAVPTASAYPTYPPSPTP